MLFTRYALLCNLKGARSTEMLFYWSKMSKSAIFIASITLSELADCGITSSSIDSKGYIRFLRILTQAFFVVNEVSCAYCSMSQNADPFHLSLSSFEIIEFWAWLRAASKTENTAASSGCVFRKCELPERTQWCSFHYHVLKLERHVKSVTMADLTIFPLTMSNTKQWAHFKKLQAFMPSFASRKVRTQPQCEWSA